MQKKLIALAIAGLSSAAFAQSNVTIYGVADVSFENVKAGGPTANAGNTALEFASRNRLQTNNSLIGFKGAESLGNGLTAVFQFETNVDTNTAGGMLGSKRDTYVGIAGSFGTVAAGYLSSPSRSTLVTFDVMPGATGAGGINALMGRVNVGAALNPLQANGSTANTFSQTAGAQNQQNMIFRTPAIAYITPTFSGVTGAIAYVPNSGRDNAAGVTAGSGAPVAGAVQRDPSAWNISLNYANGPIKVGYAYLDAKDTNVLSNLTVVPNANYTGSEKNKMHTLGASYAFPMGLTLSAVWDKISSDLGNQPAAAAATVKSVSRTGWYLGAKFVTGANEFAAAYSKVGDNSVGIAGAAAAGVSYGDDGAKQFSLRYGYNFSKRTQVYALYSKVTNDANGNYDLFNGSGAPATQQAGSDPQSFGAGIRHSF